MKVVLVVAGAVCLTFVLMGSTCKTGAADYWPMADGNTWTYRGVDIVANTDSTPDTTIVEDAMTWKCGNRMKLDDGTDVWPIEAGQGSFTYFSESRNAVLLYTDVSDATPDTWLLLPLEEGKTWTYASATMLVRGKETVEVPVGTYKDCWKVERQEAGGSSFIWFAPNVGMVVMESRYEDETFSFITRAELSHAEIR